MIYLDYASGTPIRFSASKYDSYWMNPNVNEETAKKLEICRNRVKRCLGVTGGKVIFCSNASEAARILADMCNNFAKLSYCENKKEHSSIHDVVDVMWTNGYSTFHQLVNQMTGEVFNLKKYRQENKNIKYLFVDINAAIGKYPIPRDIEDYADALFASGTKFGGPHGSGFLWLSDRLCTEFFVNDNPVNEYGIRHGTPDVPAIMAMCDALEYATTDWRIHANMKYAEHMYNRLINTLQEYNIDFAIVNYPISFDQIRAINTIILDGINARALQQYLRNQNIYIGIGASACDSSDNEYRVLKAYGLSQKECESAIRISFNEYTSDIDIIGLVEAINKFKEEYC